MCVTNEKKVLVLGLKLSFDTFLEDHSGKNILIVEKTIHMKFSLNLRVLVDNPVVFTLVMVTRGAGMVL